MVSNNAVFLILLHRNPFVVFFDTKLFLKPKQILITQYVREKKTHERE